MLYFLFCIKGVSLLIVLKSLIKMLNKNWLQGKSLKIFFQPLLNFRKININVSIAPYQVFNYVSIGVI